MLRNANGKKDAMKLLLFTLAAFSALSSASVLEESMYVRDMEMLDEALTSRYGSGDVACLIQDSSTVIQILFPSLWTASDSDLEKLGFAIGVTEPFSEAVYWNHEKVLVSFQNMDFMCTTEEVQYLATYGRSWTVVEFRNWLINHQVVSDLP